MKNLNFEKPKILYKYMTAETGFKVLQNQTIRFSNPKCFNDPYDSDMPFTIKNYKNLDNDYFIKLIDNISNNKHVQQKLPEGFDLNVAKDILTREPINKNSIDYIKDILKPFKEKMRVLCLSQNNDNLLMWSHYCFNHTGIVIGLNDYFDFFKNAVPVPYSRNVPEIDGVLLDDLTLDTKEAMEEFRRLLQTKSIDWKYESEWRCTFDVEKRLEFINKFPEFKFQYPKVYNELKNQEDFIHAPFPIESIDSVYLGAKMNILDELRLMYLIRNKYPKSKIFKAELSQTEFKIEFFEITT